MRLSRTNADSYIRFPVECMHRLLLLVWIIVMGACGTSRVSQPPIEADLAVVNVNVVDVDVGYVLSNHTVLIAGARVQAMGPSVAMGIPPGAQVIDGSEQFLIPGLWDVHVHLFNNVSRRAPNTWAFPLFVVNGVTGVREMWTEFASIPVVDQWRSSVSRGEVLAPRVIAAGALVDGPGAWMPNMPEVATPTEGQLFVRQAAQAGSDFIKIYSLLPPEVYQAILDEARAVRLPVAGHIPLQVPALDGVRAGQWTNEHLYQIREACSTIETRMIERRRQFYSAAYTEQEEIALLDSDVHQIGEHFDIQICRGVARAVAEVGQWQVPTLTNERRWFLGVPDEDVYKTWMVFIPPTQRTTWRQRLESGSATYSGDVASLRRSWHATLQVIDVLSDAGAGILVGTDFGQPFILPGFSVHEEMALLVQAGLSPLQALQAATINPARAMAATDSLGTVSPGKLADLVLLTANPLENIQHSRRISGVILNGRHLNRRALDELLSDAERAAAVAH
jgi:hypothetical protein